MDKGIFITLEGIEGSGKTTQLEMLYNKLSEADYETVITKEPGGTKIGEKIRKVLLDPDNLSMDPRAEILLYAADRAQDVTEVIKPALKAGKIVLADRYIDSNIAYQGYGRMLDMEMVKKINKWVIRDYWPDLTIILDIEAEKGIKRARDLTPDKAGDRLEQEVIDFHKRIRKAYHRMAETDARFVLVNADLPPEQLHQEVYKTVKERLL